MALITPLRMRKPDGTLYRRTPPIEAKLVELSEVSRDEIVRRCAVRQRNDVAYIPSECLIHLVRAQRLENNEAYFERLYKMLLNRVIRRLPQAGGDSQTESLTGVKIREAVLDRFIALLAEDRQTYSEKLDYFEIRFDGALASHRKDAQERAWREENRTVALEMDTETGELSLEVEKAAGSLDSVDDTIFDNVNYRSRLDAAIDTLPIEQIRIIEMLRLGIPIESKDEWAITIVKTLGKVEKTIRNHRNKALAVLRAALREDVP